MGTRFSHLKRLRLNFLSKVFHLLLVVFFGLVNTKLSYAAPQTPSQALPKMFQKPPPNCLSTSQLAPETSEKHVSNMSPQKSTKPLYAHMLVVVAILVVIFSCLIIAS